MVNCLIFAIPYFQLPKNDVYEAEKWMMLVIVDKNIFKIMTLPNDLVTVYKF